MRYWLLQLTSALLYALAFIFPSSLWPFAFIFPMPLFYAALHNNLGFKHGFVWGLVSLGLQLSGVLYTLVLMSSNSWHSTLLALLILFYLACATGLLFWATTQIKKIIVIKRPIGILAIWSLSLWLYFFWLDRCCLFIFGRMEGYCLLHPLLPLVTQPQLLRLLPIIGKQLLTLLLLLVPASIVLLLTNKNLQSACIVSIVFAPWPASVFYTYETFQRPVWLNNIAYLPACFPDCASLASAFCYECKVLLKQQPNVKLIVMPESSCYASDIHTNKQLRHAWHAQNLGSAIHIILGAFRSCDDKHFNTLFWFYNGSLQTYFDKRHAVPLTERIPAVLNFKFMHDLYFCKDPPIAASNNPRPQLNISNDISFVPYICSELFCYEYPDDSYIHTPVLAICNDSWFMHDYVKKLMFLAAQFKAIQWQRNIVYISYAYAVLCDQHGNVYNI